MVLPASYAGYADEDYGISIPTVEDYKKLGKFAAETFTPYGDIQTGKDAYNAYQQGEYLKALANVGLIGLGYTPFGLVARPVGRLAKRTFIEPGKIGLKPFQKPDLKPRKSGGAMAIDQEGLFPISEYLLKDSPFARNRGLSPATHDLIYTSHNPKVAKEIFDEGTKRNVYLTDDPRVTLRYGTDTLAVAVPKFDKRFNVGLTGTIGSGPLVNKATEGARETIMEPKMFNELLDEDLVINLGTGLTGNMHRFPLSKKREEAIDELYSKRLRTAKGGN